MSVAAAPHLKTGKGGALPQHSAHAEYIAFCGSKIYRTPQAYIAYLCKQIYIIAQARQPRLCLQAYIAYLRKQIYIIAQARQPRLCPQAYIAYLRKQIYIIAQALQLFSRYRRISRIVCFFAKASKMRTPTGPWSGGGPPRYRQLLNQKYYNNQNAKRFPQHSASAEYITFCECKIYHTPSGVYHIFAAAKIYHCAKRLPSGVYHIFAKQKYITAQQPLLLRPRPPPRRWRTRSAG